MKFKKFIKDNIKRISAVILCIIMIFSFTFPVFAFDGEAPSVIITANDLLEYHENTYVYYNSTHATYGQSPIFSPFNTKTTNAVFTISTSSDSEGILYSLNADTYISFSTGYLKQGNLKTTYIIPVVSSDSTWKEKMLTVESWLLGCPWVTADSVSWYDVFYAIMAYTYYGESSTPGFEFYYEARNLWNTLGFPSDFFSDDECRLPVVVYTVDFMSDGRIRNITYGGYYENIVNGFSDSAFAGDYGIFYPTQICMYDKNSSDDAPYSSSKTALLNEPVLQTEVINTNQYISTSTYSLTAMDYFAYEEVDNSGSYITLKSNYYALNSSQSFTIDPYVPSHFLKEEYRSNSEFTQLSKDSTQTKYYNNRDIYEEGKSWIFIGKYNTNKSVCYGGYYLEFPDGTNPILYLKLINNDNSLYGLYAQLISKVDYTLYSCAYSNGWYNHKLGTFDAEETSYTGEDRNTKFQAVDYYNNRTLIVNTTVSKYPSIRVSDSENNSKPSLSSLVYGFNCVSSCYSTLTQGVGFYYYISPENIPNIIQNSGSFGSSGSDDIGGDNRPNGSLDWEKFWEMTIDYENLYPDGFDLNLPDYPEFDFDFSGIEDIFDIPDYILIYIIEVTDWLSESLTIFVNSVGGPVKKVYYMVFLSLEAIPDVFRFVIIFSVAILLFLKVLQASSATAFMFSTSVSNGAKETKKESNRKDRNIQRQNNKKQKSKKGGD